jgi:hypothetical protein
MRPVDDAFGNWLAGFIDGEGSFGIGGGGRRRGYYCTFSLKLRGDDRDILDTIAERTGLGNVRFQPNRMRTHPQWAWLVHSKADCWSLVALLLEFPLRAKKYRDFAIWSGAVEAWNGMHGNGLDWSEMAARKAWLESGRRYSGEPVKTPTLRDRLSAQLTLE